MNPLLPAQIDADGPAWATFELPSPPRTVSSGWNAS